MAEGHRLFTEENLMQQWPVRSIAGGNSSHAVMPLLGTELSLLLHTLQYRPNAFQPPKLPLPVGDLEL